MNQMIDQIAAAVVNQLRKKLMIEAEASGRHIHLCRADVEALFGMGYQLTKIRELSQPGQFVCQERISVTGPKGTLRDVVVLGPERKETQIEISMTDSLLLGIRPPIRLSGDIENTPGAVLSNGNREIKKEKGVIIAKRHVHMTPEDAERFHVKNGDSLSIQVYGTRPAVFEDTIARVSSEYCTYAHIDYDEANACGFQKGTFCRIIH